MAIRNDILTGSDFGFEETSDAINLNDTFVGVGSYLNGFYGFGALNTDNYIFFPIGTILPWLKSLSGTPSTLPTGWQECNGTNSTPNLIGTTDSTKRFLRGTTGTTGGTGGVITHSHAFTTTTGCDDDTSTTTYSPPNITTSGNLPKRYDVVFIMKVS